MLRVRKCGTIDELERVLQGAVYSRKTPNELFIGIVGKTLIFTQPASATVTFTTESNQTDTSALTYAQVKAQLEAQVTGLKVGRSGDQFFLMQETPAAGGGVSITGGTGRNEIGLGEATAHTGKVYSGDGATSPYVVQIYATPDNSHVLVTEE